MLQGFRSSYQYRARISKANGSPVSTRTFLDEQASFCRAVLHSSVDCANHPDQLGDDFSLLHNPRATHPLDPTLFGWCEQCTFQEGNCIVHTLNQSKPLKGCDVSCTRDSKALRFAAMKRKSLTGTELMNRERKRHQKRNITIALFEKAPPSKEGRSFSAELLLFRRDPAVLVKMIMKDFFLRR